MGRISRTLNTIVGIYGSWRFVPAVGALGGCILLVAGPFIGNVYLALAGGIGLGVSLLVLHAVDVKRQDTLRGEVKSMLMAWSPELAMRSEASPKRLGPPQPKAEVTVVVTTHNEGPLLLDCLQSVADQTWRELECLVVDDLSTDHTLTSAVALFRKDPRFVFLHNTENLGLAASRNIGLRAARGRWITFLDADDLMYPDAISRRVERISSEASDPFVVGAYCGWHSVPEDAVIDDVITPEPGDRSQATWLDATYDSPFIASAPLVETEAIRAVGGFNEQLTTAEDFDLWSRLLRQGYVLLWTPIVGIGYRQRRQSMYRTSPIDHVAITAGVYASNSQPVQTQTPQSGPYLFREEAASYHLSLANIRRLITGLVTTVEKGDRQEIESIWSQIEQSFEPWMWHSIPEDLVHKTARRVHAYRIEGAEARAAVLAKSVEEKLATLPRIETMQRPAVGPGDLPASVLRLTEPSVLAGFGPSLRQEKPILLMPSAAYHCDELGPLALELDTAGLPVQFGVIRKRIEDVELELRKYPFPLRVLDQDQKDYEGVAFGAAALVTMNDWGDYREFIETAHQIDLPTFAKVEGAQDFEDVDVHWDRRPYRQARHILCQGLNDSLAVGDRGYIVGSTRLERIRKQPATSSEGRTVVINLNFTYGVLSDVAEEWLHSTIQGALRAGLEYTISAHPAQRRLGDHRYSSVPIRHLLTRPSILVSRFSTVPFEAMARGVPFVYHNPHDEEVPTFKEPLGAFPISTTPTQLGDALRSSVEIADYRKVSESFFSRQVDIDPDLTSERRASQVLAQALERRPSTVEADQS